MVSSLVRALAFGGRGNRGYAREAVLKGDHGIVKWAPVHVGSLILLEAVAAVPARLAVVRRPVVPLAPGPGGRMVQRPRGATAEMPGGPMPHCLNARAFRARWPDARRRD